LRNSSLSTMHSPLEHSYNNETNSRNKRNRSKIPNFMSHRYHQLPSLITSQLKEDNNFLKPKTTKTKKARSPTTMAYHRKNCFSTRLKWCFLMDICATTSTPHAYAKSGDWNSGELLHALNIWSNRCGAMLNKRVKSCLWLRKYVMILRCAYKSGDRFLCMSI